MRRPTVSRSENPTLLTMTQAQQTYQLSRGSLDRVARSCGARIKVGASVRYNRARLDEFFANAAETL